MRIFILLFFIQIQLLAQKKLDSFSTIPEIHIQAIRSNSIMTTSNTIIKAKEVNSINLGQDIPTLIQRAPALHISSDAGNGIGYSYLFLRGMDAQRVQVNINGVPYNDAESHEVYWVNLPDLMSSTDDIQIQRGVGFSSQGGSGLGGTISIKTTKKQLMPFVQLSSSFGSFNTLKNTISASTGQLEHGWQISSRGSYIQSDGYIDRASSKLGSAYLDLSKYGDKYTTHIIASHGVEKTYQSWFGLSLSDYDNKRLTKNIAGTDYDQKIGAPYPNQVDHFNQSHLQWINNFYWNPIHKSAITGFYTKGHGYYEEFKASQDFQSYSSEISGNGDLVRRLWLSNHLLGVNLSHITEKNNWQNILAMSFSNFSGNHYGKINEILGSYSGKIPNEFYFNQSNKSDWTLFNKYNILLGKSNFTLDLQLRAIQYNVIGSRDGGQIDWKKEFTFFNPKLGWNMNLIHQQKLYFFAGINHREPNRNDLISEESTKPVSPEKVYNLELGFEKLNKNYSLKFNLFGMYFIDQLIPTGNVNSVGAPIRENVAKSYRMGAEAEWEYSLSKSFSLYTSQYLAVNKILDYTNYLITYNPDYSINESQTIKQSFNNTDIAFSPSWISYLELNYKPYLGTNFKIMNKIVSSQFLDNTSSEAKSLPLFSFTNLSLSHTIAIKKNLKSIDLNFLVNNIFNQQFSSRGYTYFSGNILDGSGKMTTGSDNNFYFPQAGINILMGINMKW